MATVSYKGFTISENPKDNSITITIPSTMKSVTSTLQTIDNTRKDHLSSDELSIVLEVLDLIYHGQTIVGINAISTQYWR